MRKEICGKKEIADFDNIFLKFEDMAVNAFCQEH